jgi:hypothetical protein
MIPVMFALIVLGFFAVSLFFVAAEIYYERDWPRHSFKFLAISLVTLVFFFIR